MQLMKLSLIVQKAKGHSLLNNTCSRSSSSGCVTSAEKTFRITLMLPPVNRGSKQTQEWNRKSFAVV